MTNELDIFLKQASINGVLDRHIFKKTILGWDSISRNIFNKSGCGENITYITLIFRCVEAYLKNQIFIRSDEEIAADVDYVWNDKIANSSNRIKIYRTFLEQEGYISYGKEEVCGGKIFYNVHSTVQLFVKLLAPEKPEVVEIQPHVFH